MADGVSAGEQVIRIRIEDLATGLVPGMGQTRLPSGAPPRLPAAPPTLSEKISKDVGKQMSNLGKTLGKVALGVIGLTSIVGVIMKSKVLGAFGNAFLTLLGAFVDVMLMPLIPIFSQVLKLMQPILPDMMDFFDNPAKAILVGLGAILGGVIGGAIGSALGGAVGASLGGKIGGAIGTALGGPLGAVIGAIVGTLIGAGIALLISKWDEVSAWWNGVAAGVSEWWSKTIGDVGKWWNEVIGNVSGWWNSLVGNVSGWWNNLIGNVGGWWQGIIGNVSGWWQNTISNVGSWFQNIAGTVGSWWQNIINNISSWWSNLITTVRTTFVTAINSVIDLINRVPFINIPKLQGGTPFVTEDMIAQLHKGERVVPASQNVFNFYQSFTYASPSSYLAGRDMGAGFKSNLNTSLLRKQ